MLKWPKGSHQTAGKRREYLITERSHCEFPLYVRPKGERAYTEQGIYRSFIAAKCAAVELDRAE